MQHGKRKDECCSHALYQGRGYKMGQEFEMTRVSKKYPKPEIPDLGPKYTGTQLPGSEMTPSPEKERVKKWEAARLRIFRLQKKISSLQELIDDATDVDELLFFKSKKRVLEQELQLAYQTPHPEEKPGTFDEPEE